MVTIETLATVSIHQKVLLDILDYTKLHLKGDILMSTFKVKCAFVGCPCSYFNENQYPDEAKREEIANACNAVIQKPGKEVSSEGNARLHSVVCTLTLVQNAQCSPSSTPDVHVTWMK